MQNFPLISPNIQLIIDFSRCLLLFKGSQHPVTYTFYRSTSQHGDSKLIKIVYSLSKFVMQWIWHQTSGPQRRRPRVRIRQGLLFTCTSIAQIHVFWKVWFFLTHNLPFPSHFQIVYMLDYHTLLRNSNVCLFEKRFPKVHVGDHKLDCLTCYKLLFYVKSYAI